MMITGIVLSRNEKFSLMSLEVPVAANNKSMEMRLESWAERGKIDADVIMELGICEWSDAECG